MVAGAARPPPAAAGARRAPRARRVGRRAAVPGAARVGARHRQLSVQCRITADSTRTLHRTGDHVLTGGERKAPHCTHRAPPAHMHILRACPAGPTSMHVTVRRERVRESPGVITENVSVALSTVQATSAASSSAANQPRRSQALKHIGPRHRLCLTQLLPAAARVAAQLHSPPRLGHPTPQPQWPARCLCRPQAPS